MKSFCLTTMIVVFHLLCTNGIQAQTETQSIKLMNALIETDCNKSNGIVNSVEDVDFAGQGNISLLMYGSLNGCIEVVKALLDKGANTELKTIEGAKALDYAKNADIKALLTKVKK